MLSVRIVLIARLSIEPTGFDMTLPQILSRYGGRPTALIQKFPISVQQLTIPARGTRIALDPHCHVI
ncbi:MAG: hypothetical protein JWP89_4898 [Schlesneria sp.]|nr:hypothetical protein [Schlesneria sp.]